MHRIFLLGVAGVSSMAVAAEPIDEASKLITLADKQVGDKGRALEVVLRELARQLDAITKLSKQVDDQAALQKRIAPLIENAIRSGDEEVRRARQELAARQSELRAAESTLAAAKAHVGERRRAIDAAAGEERVAFEASEPFRASVARVQTLEAEVAAIEARLESDMAKDFRAAQAIEETRTHEAEVKRLRAVTPPDDIAVAEASAAWIEARGRLESARRDLHARDAGHVRTTESLREARVALTTLRDGFEASILTRPGVAAAQLALKDASFAVTQAGQSVTTIERAIERAAIDIRTRRASVDTLSRIRDESAGALLDIQRDLRKVEAGMKPILGKLIDEMEAIISIRTPLRDAIELLRTFKAEKPKK